jgi:hypothetical protein
MRLISLFCAAAALAVSPAFAQSAPGGDKDKGKSVEALHNDALAEQASKGWADAPVDERTVATHHSVNLGGRTLKYTTMRTGNPRRAFFTRLTRLTASPARTVP